VLGKIGQWCFENPKRVLLGWLFIAVSIFGLTAYIGSAYDGSFEIPESDSRDGFIVLDEYFDGAGSGYRGSIVFRADQGVLDPTIRDAMEKMFDQTTQFEGIASVVSPYDEILGRGQVNPTGQVAFAEVTVSGDIDQTGGGILGEEIRGIAPNIDGLEIEIGGQILGGFEPPESEFIGLAFAVVVLIFAFGSVLAMGLPIAVAVAGVGVGIALITLISNVYAVPDFAPTLGAMIGLGVGIDYALLIVTRYRESLNAGKSPKDATVLAMSTAGHSVIFAGLTVVISLLGLLLVGFQFMSGLGISAATTVLVTMLASITLLPCLLGFVKDQIETTYWYQLLAASFISVGLLGFGLGTQELLIVGLPGALVLFLIGRFLPFLKWKVPKRKTRPLQETYPYRWSRIVQRKPWGALIIGTAILLLFASPILSLNLGFSDEGNYPEDTTTRRAYDLISDGFGPGFNGPLVITAKTSRPSDFENLQQLMYALNAATGVAAVSPPIPSDMDNPDQSGAFLINLIPTTGPQSSDTNDLVSEIRNNIVPDITKNSTLQINVTGLVATNTDFTDYLAGRLLLFFSAILAVSFLFLLIVFRSILVPIKAVIMNVLSIGAAYGIVVAVFQWGWLGSLIGIDGAPIEPFVPMMMFAILFGLSMDYEVFLLSRVKEEYDTKGNAEESVADGLASTAQVITAAASIMVVVFGSFILEDDRIVKLFGLGLGVAIFLDASIVRMLLVPATMQLLGKNNWWIPSVIDRMLPHINVDGNIPNEESGVSNLD